MENRINIVDENGFKQGYWFTLENGSKWEGCYENGNRIGIWKHHHSLLNAYVKLYYDNNCRFIYSIDENDIDVKYSTRMFPSLKIATHQIIHIEFKYEL